MERGRFNIGRIAGWIIPAAAAAVLAALIFVWVTRPRGREGLERGFEKDGLVPVSFSTEIRPGRAGVSVRFDRGSLAHHRLYLRESGDEGEWLFIGADGTVESSAGVECPTLTVRAGELLVTPDGTSLILDGTPLCRDFSEWVKFWVAGAAASSPPRAVDIPRVEVSDDFMREELEVHPFARVTGGQVSLVQHGGGMPATFEERLDPTFQRAVNPFSVYASSHGRLTYAVHSPERWGDVHAEARFYFGLPRTGHVVDRGTLPVHTDMLVAMGPEDGYQVAFGWSGSGGAFALLVRSGDAPWRVIEKRAGKRPAVTNWVRIGLTVRRGFQAEGYLDGAAVLSAELPAAIRGPFHIQSGAGRAEFDNVRAYSLPASPPEPACLIVSSRQFAGKKRKGKADPEEFEEWSASTHVFRKMRWTDRVRGERSLGIVTQIPLMGDFYCDPGDLDRSGQSIPEGIYTFSLLPSGETLNPQPGSEDNPLLCSIHAEREADAWEVKIPPISQSEQTRTMTVPDLKFSRLAEMGNRFCLESGDEWLPVSEPIPGPVYLAVARTSSQKSKHRFVFFPSPEDHVVSCANLVNELFEEAPSDWSWVDGAFRMDCRWACEDQWNFMACGSTGLPRMTSKRTFRGDQFHEYFICLRAAMPWDAGDETFVYDPRVDMKDDFRRIRKANGWYNRRDLNFSFCSDGKDPLSGYCVVFGGDDNTATRLLRRGEVVAETKNSRFLFPRGSSYMPYHYTWWQFRIRKIGPRIQVYLDDSSLFDYTDPDPIPGGHIGFWSIRNAFVVSRVASVAEQLGRSPEVLYVQDTGAGGSWTPLVRDAVSIASDPGSGLVRVTNNAGGGFFAVRHTFDSPIDLTETPILELPIKMGTNIAVNLHLYIGGRSYLIRLGDAPLSGMKTILTPEYETGECFRLPDLKVAKLERTCLLGEVPGNTGLVRMNLLERLSELEDSPDEPLLEMITVGNSSNEQYLMAGNGRNRAGDSFSVGLPVFLEE